MLVTKKNDNGKLLVIDGTFEGYFNAEGYKQIEITGVDTSTSEKGYIVLYVFDKENHVVNMVNLRIQSSNDHTSEVPLESIIRLAFADEMEEEGYFYEINLDELIGFELQIKVEKVNNYYNVTGVYHINEELEEFVSREEKLKQRIPKNLFNKKENNNLPFIQDNWKEVIGDEFHDIE